MNHPAATRLRNLGQCWLENKTRIAKILISAWLLFYYCLTLIHIAPDGPLSIGPLSIRLKEPTRVLCEYFGWVQNWRLFGPEVRTINFHTFGLIGYEDGTIGSWEPPRFDLINLHQKYCKDKFHKWDADCIAWYNYRDFWPGLARWVGRMHYDPNNKPAWFMLLRFEADIPNPTSNPVLDHDHMPPHSRLLNSFFYHYLPGDFK